MMVSEGVLGGLLGVFKGETGGIFSESPIYLI